VKAKFDGRSPPLNGIGSATSKEAIMKRAGEIIRSEGRTALKRGDANNAAVLIAENKNTGEFFAYKGNLSVRNSNRYLFAITKICVEYLYYVSIKKNIYIAFDPVFRQICSALHQYTKIDKTNPTTATKNATAILEIGNTGVNSDHIMLFELNSFSRMITVEEYVKMASNDNREHIIYWLQIVNLCGYAGVLIVLGNLSPMIGIAGSKQLAYRLGIIHEGQTLQRDSKFR
jgi:hypothetical protein